MCYIDFPLYFLRKTVGFINKGLSHGSYRKEAYKLIYRKHSEIFEMFADKSHATPNDQRSGTQKIWHEKL